MSAGARTLNDRLAVEIDAGNFERRIAEIKAGRWLAADLAHADLADPGVAKRQSFLDSTDHHNTRCTVRQGHGGGRERSKNIDDSYGAGCPLSTFEKAVERDFRRNGPISDTKATTALVEQRPAQQRRSCRAIVVLPPKSALRMNKGSP